MSNEILEKLANRTIEYLNEDLGLSVENLIESNEVDKIDYQDITTLISLSGDMAGTVGMSVSNELAYTMVENFIYGDVTQEEIEDMASENVAETLNITVGNILKELSIVKKGGSLNISTPYTMHNCVSITKKKNGKMFLSKLKYNDETILLSYFV